MQRATHGWAHVDALRKREIIDAIVRGTATRGPAHLELNLTDRCNVKCYFCNQQDLRTSESLSLAHIENLLDELVPAGLKSVRLAGGGDPLFHKEIGRVLDALALRGVIVDNVTTNGVGLSSDITQRLVEHHAREVLVSLNAGSAADYARMMQVRPQTFDRVTSNIRELTSRRGDAPLPTVVVQFLIDRENVTAIPEMYRVARDLGADVIAMNLVGEIPLERISPELILGPADAELLRVPLRETLELDRDRRLLQLWFQHPEMNAVLLEEQKRTGVAANPGFATSPSFRDENGGCFFAWYSAVVRGNGDLHLCCLTQNPEIAPVGSVKERSFADEWNGPTFTQARKEMRDVLLARGDIRFSYEQFQVLQPFCVINGQCYLKNSYFRPDDDFYRELGAALEELRGRERVQYVTRRDRLQSTLGPRWRRAFVLYDFLRDRTRPLRHRLRRRKR